MRESLDERKSSPSQGRPLQAARPKHAQVSFRDARLPARARILSSTLCAALTTLGCSGSDEDDSGTASVPGLPAFPSDSQEPARQSSDSETTVPPNTTSANEPSSPSSPGIVSELTPDDETAVPESAEPCAHRQTFDDEFRAIASDVSRDVQDAPFYRYLSLGHRANLGICPEDMQADRDALIKALNSLSTESTISLPQSVDADALLYRIDIRDYGWDQPTQVGGVEFSDKWEAIVSASPYAIEFEGDDANIAKQLSGTTIPVLSSDALIDATSVGDLYYALIDVGASAFELFAQLGIDFFNDDIVRAGTDNSSMSTQDTLINRFDLGARQGFYWSRLDIADGTNASVVADPLGFPIDVAPALFTLPNGLLGFVLFNAQFQRVAETDVLADGLERDSLMRNSVSCSGCHFSGVLPVADQVLPYIQGNPFNFDSDTVEQLEEDFVPQPELDDYFRSDNALYQSALARAGLSGMATDPVARVYRRFDADVTLQVAAAELAVNPADVEREFGLEEPTISRARFDALFREMVCALHVSDENRPAAAACASQSQ